MRWFCASGGGAKGQWHLGVLRRLVGDLGVSYDGFAGVSVGALICGFLAQFERGREAESLEALERVFAEVRTEDIYRSWCPFGKLSALWKPSLYDATPLTRLVREGLDAGRIRRSGRRLRVVAFDLEAGVGRTFTERDPEIVDAVLASAAYPVAFQPVEINGTLYTDGGVRTVTPIGAAIDAGAKRVDASVCHAPFPERVEFDDDPPIWKLALRSVEGMSEEIVAKDVKLAQLYTRLCELGAGAGKRPVDVTVVRPKARLLDDPLRFDPKEAERLRALGYAEACRIYPFGGCRAKEPAAPGGEGSR